MREYQWSEEKLEKLKAGFRKEDVLGNVEVTPPPPTATTTTMKVPGNKAFKPPTRMAVPASTLKQRFIPKPKFGIKTPSTKKPKLDDSDSLSSGIGYDDCDDGFGTPVIDITSTAENERPGGGGDGGGDDGGVISSSPLASLTSTLDGSDEDGGDEDVEMLDVNTPTTQKITTRKRNIHLDSDSDDLLDVNELLRQPTPRRKKENGRKLALAMPSSSSSTIVPNDRAKKRRILDSEDENDEDEEEEDEL